MPILARPKVLKRKLPQAVAPPVPTKRIVAEAAKVKEVYRKAEERAAAKIPTLAKVSKAGARFAKKHPTAAKQIYTTFERAHVKTQQYGTNTQRQALAGYTYGSYQALQTKPIKTSAMFGAGLVGGRAISVVGKVGKAFGAGAKSAKMAKAAELGIVGVYGYKTTEHIMDAPTPYRAGQRAADAMYTEVLPMVAGARLVRGKVVKEPTKPPTKPPITAKAKAAAKAKAKEVKAKAKREARYKAARAARPAIARMKMKRADVKAKTIHAKRLVRIQKMKSQTALKNELASAKKQLVKLAKDERAEVELVKVKEKTIHKTERIKSSVELNREIIKTKASIKSLQSRIKEWETPTLKQQLKIKTQKLRELESEKIKREMVYEDIKTLKQRVRSTRIKIKQNEKVIVTATERVGVLVGVTVKVIERVTAKEREIEKEVEKVMERELEKVKEIEKVFERLRMKEREREREIEIEKQKVREKERVRVKEKVKEEMPMPIPIIPKLRVVEKKKVVKVARVVRKEYTNFQIVNQMTGINQLFG